MQLMKRLTKLEPIELDIELGQKTFMKMIAREI